MKFFELFLVFPRDVRTGQYQESHGPLKLYVDDKGYNKAGTETHKLRWSKSSEQRG